MQLHTTGSPINRDERIKLNENWQLIMKECARLQAQINILSGDTSVEEILNELDEAIENANNTVANLEVQVQQAISDNDTATQDAIANLNSELNTALDTIASKLNELETAISDAETATTNANNATSEAQTATSDALNAIQDMQSFVNELAVVGEYDPTANYDKNNMVRYNKAIYIALKDGLMGVEPINDGVNWRLVVRDGIDGTGAISTVNGITPDENGNIQLTADDVGAVDESEFTQLSQEVNNNATDIANVQQTVNAHKADVATYTGICTYSNNVYTITFDSEIVNDIFTVKFKAPNDYVNGSSFSIKGIDYNPVNPMFEAGEVVTVNFDKGQTKAFFKQGGVNDTLPPQIDNFVAESGDEKIDLSWTISDTDYLDGYVFTYKEGSEPQSINDGIKVTADKTATTLTITGLTNDVVYYIRPFPYNAKKQYQTEFTVVQATPKAGTLLSDLPVGTLVKDLNTRYNGKPIVFQVAAKNHAGYPANSVTLITERIIMLKPFDAKEPNNSNSDRRNYGNNRYLHSNIRQWLNKDSNPWYAAQHGADQAPNSANVWNGHNPYNTEPGFLANFSAPFKNSILTTSLTVAKNTVTDGGGSETVQDKVFLPSTTEVGLANENNIAEGSKWPLFTNDASRQANPTPEAVSNSSYTNTDLDASKPWMWWLRTPNSGGSSTARCVHTPGALGNSGAWDGSWGARPALNLPSEILVSNNPDADGTYVILF